MALEIEADAIKAKLKENEDAAGKIKEELLSARKDRELLSTLRGAENTQLEVLKSQCASDGQRLDAQREELKKITESESEYEERRLEGEKALKAAEAETEKITQAISELEERKSASAREISSQGRSHSALLVKFTAAQKDAESARRDFDFTLSSIKAAKDKLETGEAEMIEREKRLIENDNRANLDKAETERLKELARKMDEEIKKSTLDFRRREQSESCQRDKKPYPRARASFTGEYARSTPAAERYRQIEKSWSPPSGKNTSLPPTRRRSWAIPLSMQKTAGRRLPSYPKPAQNCGSLAM